MNKFLITLVLCLIMASGARAQTLKLDLEQSVLLALKNNVNMKMPRKNLLKPRLNEKKPFLQPCLSFQLLVNFRIVFQLPLNLLPFPFPLV